MTPLDKDQVRAAARAARAQLTPERREAAAEAAAAQLLAVPELRAARRVLVYAPMPDELDPFLANREPSPLAQLVWPRVADRAAGKLTLHACAESELVTGGFGLREPRADAPQVALADIDVVLVPGLAFDQAGYRVGYGKGYYDRLLAPAPESLLTIGLCFEETFYPEIAHDDHDIPVARVIVA